ncbi:glycosyltransferase [Ruficoccus sp. ZRK36]|uniref:glycosyltransferase n=1 Tax=Ruficoccus sp. ZRK36 TaxID=2866311 RepID=UPI001C72DDDA|nr:glycosyltransferase [Ruficoccus sp. ZRK36]QYY37386.1 glycosyltransferase [Ruficoccus sp. ZRK36]
MSEPNGTHILFFEPRTEGHHMLWTGLIVEALADKGYTVTVAADLRENKALKILTEKHPHIAERSRFISLYGEDGELHGGAAIPALLHAYEQVQPDAVFVNSLDEFGSKLLRTAALGSNPLKAIRCGLSGIYHRPRFLEPGLSPRNLSKKIGFSRLDKAGLFKHVFLLDDTLIGRPTLEKFRTKFHYCPCPAEGEFTAPREEARERLGLPADVPVLLHYGLGARRKGLHLLLKALEKLPPATDYRLVVAGRQPADAEWLPALERLEKSGKGKVLNYYISSQEEADCLRASDLVTIPYLGHYGVANLLSQSALAERPVLASDHHLIGKTVENHQLGFTFKDQNETDLLRVLTEIFGTYPQWRDTFTPQLHAYARMVSVENFREVIQSVGY